MDLQAQHFLKLSGSRLGRDIELYGLLVKLLGEHLVLLDLYEDWILPLKRVGRCYSVGAMVLYNMGKDCFEKEGVSGHWGQMFGFLKSGEK